MKKKHFLLCAILIIILPLMTACNELDICCTWCGNKPTKEYKTINGTSTYVCKKCREKCYFCFSKAKHHYTDKTDRVIFVCETCYKNIRGR